MLYVVILGTPLFLIFPTHLRVLHDEAELRVRERYWASYWFPCFDWLRDFSGGSSHGRESLCAWRNYLLNVMSFSSCLVHHCELVGQFGLLRNLQHLPRQDRDRRGCVVLHDHGHDHVNV